VALATFLVGAGFLMFITMGPSVSTRPLPESVVAVSPSADAPDTGTVFTSDGLGPPTSPADELSALPPLPANHPRDEVYLIISRSYNRLWLMRGETILHVAVCATGKGDTLVWEKTGKKWVFETPQGEFSVQHKSSNPRWLPPEWDYVERDEEPPDWLTRARASRYDMLGDYAINFGGDYNIHGTLYEGLLGRSITHGCVRVGARDLAFIYPRVKVGTKIYIY